MFRFFKRKQEKKAADNFALLANMLKEKQAASISEPWTLAKARLEGGAKDAGAGKGLRMYNAHLSRLQNQWINPLQSVNSGYGTAHASLFLYQPVNYYECYSLAQDPLFAKVFNVLSETPFAKGGELSNLSAEEKDRAEEAASRFDLWQHLRAAVRSNYVTGGCLLYMDFGLSGRELEEPLDLNRMDMKRFRGFRHIDPINCVAVQVNTVNPAAGDYMQPSIWYVIGLGTVHKSHFLKFEANIPELPMRPLTLYFGMPLTQLIKQDVANSNLASQGLANLMNRFRFTYLKADESSFTTENAKCFKDRLNFMSFVQDNFGVCPIKTTEDVMQLTTSLAGMAENVEEFYLLISAKTDIPYTELMGKSAEGMNATGSGDRRKWYDKCRSIQESVKNNLLFMYGIVAGVDSGKFVKFTDFTFNPLEEATEKELAENIKSYAEVASALVNLGAKQDEVFEWLKQFKQFNLDGLSFDTETEGLGGYEDITPQVMSEFQAMNWVENPERWITMKSQPVPVEKGQSSKDAAKRFLEEKGRKLKDRDEGSVESYTGKAKSFESTEEIEKFFGESGAPLLERRKNPAQQWQFSLSATQKKYIHDYTADMYGDINNYLRGREYGKSYYVKEAVENLDKAIEDFPLSEDIRVFRAINPDAFKGKDLKKQIGERYTDKGYMSSSPYLYSTGVNKDLVFDIVVPKGKGRGAWVNGLSGFKGKEYEFLLKRGGNFVITDYYEKDGKKFLKMEMIADD